VRLGRRLADAPWLTSPTRQSGQIWPEPLGQAKVEPGHVAHERLTRGLILARWPGLDFPNSILLF
jgi:hypothetical protein